MAYDDLTGLDAPKLLEDMNNKEKVPLTPKKDCSRFEIGLW